MKMISRVSLLLNLGLAAWVICLLVHKRNADLKDPIQSTTQVSPAPPPLSASVVPVSVDAAAKPFRWSSIESTNYRTYIANLRGIECPEQTIHDLITADVDALYAPAREQLKQKMESKIKAAPEGSIFAQEEFQRGLDQLNTEERTLIASLLGSASSGAGPATVASAFHSRARAPAVMPMVFQDVDPAALHLTDSQAAIIDGIKQDFLQQVGGSNQDPDDPAYRQRWLPAQRQADSMLEGMLGSAFVQNYQLQLMKQSEQPVR